MKDNPQTQTRPPIVVVMGHVDHCKTTLLDYIRKTKVAEKEAGGITQHVGAYEVEHQGKKITFIDTPGHEAFSKMRSRGAKVADIAILVVAADEGVKEQTLEALSHIKEAEMPFAVAINKIDKPGADTNKLKGALAEHEVVVESWGGKIPSVEISAKLGTNIDQLLELILLMAEMEELKGDAARPAEGVIIESHLDPRKGPLATLLVKEGTLKVGDFLACGGIIAKIKNMNDFTGRAVASASFSSPLAVSGFQEVPDVGADCKAAENKKAAEHIAAEQKKEIKEI
ncbi:MAG: translation initiation factor IF-2, partial [Patescibacteria group bacterium]